MILGTWALTNSIQAFLRGAILLSSGCLLALKHGGVKHPHVQTYSLIIDQQGSQNERNTTQTLQPGVRRRPPLPPWGSYISWGRSGLGQMTQDTYGKPYLHTFLAFIKS